MSGEVGSNPALTRSGLSALGAGVELRPCSSSSRITSADAFFQVGELLIDRLQIFQTPPRYFSGADRNE